MNDTEIAQTELESLEQALFASTSSFFDSEVVVAAKKLKEKGGNVDKRNHIDRTPLYYAVSNGLVGAVSFLISEGCDINASDITGVSPLMLAFGGENIDMINIMLSHGANPDIEYKKGTPVLFRLLSRMRYDVKGTNKEIAKALIDFGANVNANNGEGKRCLSHFVIENEDEVDFIDLLCRHGADVNGKDSNGMTALMHAARDGKIKFAESLIYRKANIEERDSDGHTAIFFAVMFKKFEMFMFLAEKRARLDAVSNKGVSLLAIAAWNRFGRLPRDDSYENLKKISEYLIKEGVDVNQKDKDKETALHHAAHNNDVPMCELLVENGALIDELDSYNLTPLGNAIFEGSCDSAKYLLSKGARFDTKDNFNRTPLERAREKEMHEIVKLMEAIKVEDGSKRTGNPTKKTKTNGCDVQ